MNKEIFGEVNLFLPEEDATLQLAQALAELVAQGATAGTPSGRFHLRGDLGAGKTTFARAFLRAFGVQGRIKSPSYALLESYKVSNLYLYHLDFYRFSDPREWIDAGFRDILQQQAIILIEWPEQAGNLLPDPDLEISLDYAENGRNARLIAYSKKGQSWLTQLKLPTRGSRPKDSPAAD